MRAETFLSMYRVLEGLLGDKYADAAKSQSVVVLYIQDAESEPVRRQLDVCREVRNLLTHSSDENGRPLVEPSQALLDSLYEIINYIQTPKSALMYVTKSESLLCAHPNDRALDIMRRMERMGISHVPVTDGGRLIGAFNSYVVMARLLDGQKIDSDTRIREFGSLLSFSSTGGVRYLILGPDASYVDARNEFEKKYDRNRRLAAIFITDTGDEQGTLQGMLTPWDLMRDSLD